MHAAPAQSRARAQIVPRVIGASGPNADARMARDGRPQNRSPILRWAQSLSTRTAPSRMVRRCLLTRAELYLQCLRCRGQVSQAAAPLWILDLTGAPVGVH